MRINPIATAPISQRAGLPSRDGRAGGVAGEAGVGEGVSGRRVSCRLEEAVLWASPPGVVVRLKRFINFRAAPM